MELLVSFAALVLACTAVHVAGQPGFLSIACGREANYNGYENTYTGIDYVSDVPYVDGGETHSVTSEYENVSPELHTLRSFPSGGRNCYTLPTESGAKYLVRMAFVYGNYDGKNSLQLQFDLYLGTNYWNTARVTGGKSSATVYEAVFVAWASWVPVCLVNTGQGTPFVSSVELRRLGDSIYPQLTADHSMSMYDRINMGADTFIRYHDDLDDRIWWAGVASDWANISTPATIDVSESKYAVPVKALQTAVVSNGTVLNMAWTDHRQALKFKVLLHFADFQNSRLRQFNISVNNEAFNMCSPLYLTSSSVQTDWFSATDSKLAITLTATAKSVLSPMLNAYEIYNIINHDTPTTFSKDCLDYLHKGCILPIIHRDVKTSNILLGQNLQAKIADFGLCKTYLSDMQTHISTNAAGTPDYFDPEYFQTGRLTESSDVYSFGIVLLEMVTGAPAMLPNHGHIVQRMKQKIATGNISSVTDARLGDDYEVSSMWKVVDTAMACTTDDAVRRPTMATVVVQLKESLALEEARGENDFSGSRSDSASLVSTFGPSAR